MTIIMVITIITFFWSSFDSYRSACERACHIMNSAISIITNLNFSKGNFINSEKRIIPIITRVKKNIPPLRFKYSLVSSFIFLLP